MGRQAACGERRHRRTRQRLHAAQNRVATMAAVRSYREWMARYAPCPSSTSGTRTSPTTTSAPPARPPSRVQGHRQAAGDDRQALQQGARPRSDARREPADHGRRRPAAIILDPPIIQHVEIPGRPSGDAQGLRGLPRDDGREPARVPGALPVRRLRTQGRRRRQRGDALLRARPRGSRRERHPHPPGKGGDRVGARRALGQGRLRESRRSASWWASA